MQNHRKWKAGDLIIGVCFLIFFTAFLVAIFVPTVSDTTQVVLLGGGLLLAGMWGRRTFNQE